jgi:serine/threonine protein kinase
MSDAPRPAQSIDDFLKVLRASGLVEESRLEKVIEPWRAASGPVPEELPAALIDAELITPWQFEQLRKGKHKGFMLGKYKLLRLLGAGGMSSVYLAEHSTLHNKVAIKVLPVKRVTETSYLARFEREARATAQLNHPNIARAFDLDTSGSIHFIVLEYIEGTDLHAKVKQDGPLDVREAAEYVRQAALGLHHAHEEGLVHRDVKPANLMLDKRGTVKILDLGLALGDDDEEASLTREHDEKVLGTADYLAPEQARDSHKADRRSDIYSLGCALHYLLVGRAPFAKGSLAERIRAHMNEPAPHIMDERSDVPSAIADIYFRMLEKHPDARPQTAKEVADSLGAWLAATAAQPSSGPTEPPRRSADSLRRSPGSGKAAPNSAPRRLAPPAPVVRSGPGSGSGSGIRLGGSGARRGPESSGSGSNVDLSTLSFTPPPSSGDRSTQKLPDITITTGVSSAEKKKTPKTGNAPVKKPPAAAAGKLPGLRGAWQRFNEKQVAGLPIMFWILAGVGLLAAIGLAIKVFTSGRS